MTEYLKTLWVHSKVASIILGIFVLTQIYLSYKSIEITPWLHWAMYSKADTERNLYTVYRVKTDGMFVVLSDFNDLERECLSAPLAFYAYLLENDFKEPWEEYYMEKIGSQTSKFTVDSSIQEDFQQWYKKRLSTYLNTEVESVELYKVQYSYEDGIPIEQQQNLIQSF